MNSEPGIQRLQASRRRETRSLFSRQHGSRSRELTAAGNKAAPRNFENTDGESKTQGLSATLRLTSMFSSPAGINQLSLRL